MRSFWVVPVLLVACGGSTPRPPVDSSARTSQVAAEPPPDLSPVAAPEDLISVARLRDPAALLDTLSAWSGLGVDWRALVANEEPRLAQAIAWDAPVDAAVALDPLSTDRVPQPFAVVSVGVKSLDVGVTLAKTHGLSPRRLRPGVFRLTGTDASCAIAASVGRAPARLVCGDRDSDVDALLPYVTRGLPNETVGEAELHAELRVEPLRRRHGAQLRQMKTLALPFVLKQMSLDTPRFDRALAEIAHAAADEILLLSDDLQGMSLDVRFLRDAGYAEAVTRLDFVGSSSWTAMVLGDAAVRSAAPPDEFWKLPAASVAASFDQGADVKHYAGIQRTLAELAGGFLEHEKAPRATVQRVVDLVETAPLLGGVSVYARGDLPRAAGAQADPAQRLRQKLGWMWMGVSEPANRLRRWLDAFQRASDDPALRKLLEQRFELVRGALPRVKRRPARGLPAGATTYEVALPPELAEGDLLQALRMPSPLAAETGKPPDKARRAVSVVVVLAPDGDRTWLGFAGEEAALVAPLRAIRQGSEQERLATRAGLEWLRTLRASSGGFVTMRSFADEIGDLSGPRGPGQPEPDVAGIFDTLPSRGATPMAYGASVTKEPALVAAWALRVPKAVFTDLAAMLPAIAARRGGPLAVPAPP